MSNKSNFESSSSSITEEVKEQNNKYTLSKFDYDLFKDEDNISEKVVRIKRISLPNKGEKWKVFSDNKVIFIIEGSKLTKKEKDFLHTVNGLNFVLNYAKSENISFNKFKAELKNKIK